MALLKNLSRSPRVQRFLGRTMGRYLKLVYKTSRFRFEPADALDRIDNNWPVIIAMWHGQHFLIPAFRRPNDDIRALISHHRDGEINAQLVEYFGAGLVRGSGLDGNPLGRAEDIRRKRGSSALRALVKALGEGATVVQTADVPKRARYAGLGIVTLARNSQRPIIPLAIATSRRLELKSWDRASVHLPFSRGAFVVGEPILIPGDINKTDMEPYRLQVEDGLNLAAAKAEDMVNGKMRAPDKPITLKFYFRLAQLLEPLSRHLLEYRVRRGKEIVSRLDERKGIANLPRPGGRIIWIHAASVGEAASILPLASRLLEGGASENILITTGTVTSARLIESRAGPGIIHQFSPLDIPIYVQRFLDYWKPQLAIFVESELWPNMLCGLNEAAIPTILVNARLSEASAARWKRFPVTIKYLLDSFAHCIAQTDQDGARLKNLGADRMTISGNLKYDSPPPPTDLLQLTLFKTALLRRPVWAAISTHPGEDELVADANEIAARKIPGLLAIIVPRHPERGAQIAQMLTDRGLSVARRSQNILPDGNTDIYIADTLGEIGLFCTVAPLVFVGGSLVPHGGQNPIEPIKLGAAVLHGPHVHNFTEIYDVLVQNDAVNTVTDSIELAHAVVQFMQSDKRRHEMVARGQKLVSELTGALDRTLKSVAPFLPAKDQK
ncbi:MAG: DUF374 domain-containing protein [Fimbriimonadaceae bacterium]|nr:DUF374 domain-containing protein [Alphaproteobacteria bacterium]